jgi:hypothetical protein
MEPSKFLWVHPHFSYTLYSSSMDLFLGLTILLFRWYLGPFPAKSTLDLRDLWCGIKALLVKIRTLLQLLLPWPDSYKATLAGVELRSPLQWPGLQWECVLHKVGWAKPGGQGAFQDGGRDPG